MLSNLAYVATKRSQRADLEVQELVQREKHDCIAKIIHTRVGADPETIKQSRGITDSKGLQTRKRPACLLHVSRLPSSTGSPSIPLVPDS